MTTQDFAPDARVSQHAIEVADQNLTFRQRFVPDATPTGSQISHAAGFAPAQQTAVLRFTTDGDLEEIRPNQSVDLVSGNKFIVVETDRLFFLTIDGERFDWPARTISGEVVRKLGRIPAEDELLLTRVDEPDRVIEAHENVDLGHRGTEAFISRKPVWKLNVQGVLLDFHKPTVVVREALQKAGFDITKAWQIFLIVKGQPKLAVNLDYVVDMRTPGIEKLRLTPDGVHNGEAPAKPRRVFDLLDVDEKHLDGLGCFWETIIDANRRWLLIHNYRVPTGYSPQIVLLALEIPPTYPGAQIDMFYTNPPLRLTSGSAIDRTQVSAVINGAPFNGWSRHRGPQAPWNPNTDNVITHLALVESAIAKEVGQ